MGSITAQPLLLRLEGFVDSFGRDMPIDQLELIEHDMKQVLREACAHPLPGDMARKLAMLQRSVGFLRKYKSYGVKAALPTGYSVFLLNARQGFSLQRHVSVKTEVFHILDVCDGGICLSLRIR